MRGLPLDRAARVRALDAAWMAHTGMSAELLVEHAGHACARAILERFPSAQRVAVVCGPGNNGADGYVIARHLAIAGREVRAVGILPPRTPEAVLHAEIAVRMGLVASSLADFSCDLVVDAVFGTGQRAPLPWSGALFDPEAWGGGGPPPSRSSLEDDLRGRGRQLDEPGSSPPFGGRFLPTLAAQGPVGANRGGVPPQRLPGSVPSPPVVAIDAPTGVDADTGERLGAFADPAFVVVIGRLKPYLLRTTVPWTFVDLGFGLLDGGATPEAVWCELAPPAAEWPADAHKWSRGHVGVRAGSANLAGAAVLACRGALRMGAGLVTLFIEREAWPRLGALPPEVMVHAPEELAGPAGQRCDALVLGPGLGRTADEEVRAIWSLDPRPVVVDADALTALSTLREAPGGPRLLTPHAGEAGRLLGCAREAIEADRLGAARALRSIAPSILKGTHPLVTGVPILAVRGGVPQLGTGGSGDVLAGACGALLARAAVSGVFAELGAQEASREHVCATVERFAAHAVAAHLEAGRRAGPVGVTASDIADALVGPHLPHR